MNAPRLLPVADYAALSTAFRVLVSRVGGLEAAASATRVGTSRLAEYGSLHHPDRQAPIDVVADLENIAGAPVVSAVLARLAGHSLALMQPVEGGSDISAISDALASAATLGAAFAAAMHDGALGDADRGALAEQLGSLARAAMAGQAMLAGPRA